MIPKLRVAQCLAAALTVLLLGCGGGSTAPAPTSTPVTPPTQRPALGAPSPAPKPSPVAAASPAASPSPIVTRSIVYVAIGASDTVGEGAANPAQDGWVPQLARMLGSGTRVRNLGVSGTLLETALRDQLPVAVRDQPDLVTVWLAVNDLNAQVPLQRYSTELNMLLSALNQQTRARVLIANVPNLTVVPRYRGVDAAALSQEIARWNEVIADAARRHNTTVVDLYGTYAELVARPEDISADGFHPSAAGYRRIAERFYAAAQTALGQ
jgi:lysophospholipase L1-like esterase